MALVKDSRKAETVYDELHVKAGNARALAREADRRLNEGADDTRVMGHHADYWYGMHDAYLIAASHLVDADKPVLPEILK